MNKIKNRKLQKTKSIILKHMLIITHIIIGSAYNKTTYRNVKGL